MDSIKTVIENPGPNNAPAIYEKIKNEFPVLLDYIDKFKTSDLHGGPELSILNNELSMAASTLRYVYTMGKINMLVGLRHGMRIAEIGGGYGGQCKIIQDIYDVDYTIFDIPQVSDLQKEFLSRLGVDFNFGSANIEGRYDLCISWCGWSELARNDKEWYFDNVIKDSNRIFIGSNFDSKEDCEILSKYFDIRTEFNENGRGIIYA